jgi:uncharacterized repeat protein (TIGR01451 family)
MRRITGDDGVDRSAEACNMKRRARWTALILSTLLGCLTARLSTHAGPRPVQARTAQYAPCQTEASPCPETAQEACPDTCPDACPEPCPGQQPAPEPRGQQASAFDPSIPVVSVRVQVPANTAADQQLVYQIRAENVSRAPAHHVLIRCPLPTNAKYVAARPEPIQRDPEVQWRVGTMEPGVIRDFELTVRPTGSGDISTCARVQFEYGQCVVTRVTRPGIALRVNGPTEAVLFDSIPYTITVDNIGGTPIASGTLTATLPAGLEHATGRTSLTWDLGAIDVGQSRTVEYQAVAKSQGRLCTKFLASMTGGLREEAENCIVITEPKLNLTMVGPKLRYVNLNAAYGLTVSNIGTAPITNVVVRNPLPAGMGFVSASGGGQLSGAEVQWALGTLPPGTRKTVDVVLRARNEGEIRNRATASADRGMTAQAEMVTKFEGVSALTTTLRDKDDPLEVGGETSYEIVVKNQGMKPAPNVLVVATVPPELAVVRALGPSDNKKVETQIIFDPVVIQPGSEVKYQIFVKALKAGDVRFKVDVASDVLPAGPVHDEESTFIYADLPAGKTPPGSKQSRIKSQR